MGSILSDFTYFTIHSTYNCLQPCLPRLPSSAAISLFSRSMNLSLFCKEVHLCHNLDSTYKRYHNGICISLSDYFV